MNERYTELLRLEIAAKERELERVIRDKCPFVAGRIRMEIAALTEELNNSQSIINKHKPIWI